MHSNEMPDGVLDRCWLCAHMQAVVERLISNIAISLKLLSIC